jgi:predicted transposase YbfD/YdcC
MAPAHLVEIFSTIPDPRIARTRVHKLVDILIMALLAVINGAVGWEDIAEFAQVRETWLRGFLELPGGPPCADTFRRVFEAIDERAFGRCLAEVTSTLTADLAGQGVAIDGKTLRRSFDRRSGASSIHVVSAWVAGMGLTLGQVVTDQKSNEITAIPALLEVIDVKGAVVTIDAMGCQKKIAAAIIDAEADYALALKDNHPTLRQDVEAAFSAASTVDGDESPVDSCIVENKGHGRHEVRKVSVLGVVDGLHEAAEWKNLRSIVMVERERTVNERTSFERVYYLSSLLVDAATMGRHIRAHWSIENTLHWTLDVVFNEDQSRIRVGAANFTQVRKLALSLLKLEQSRPGKSIAMKRKRAGWDPDYALRVLSTIPRL